MPRKRGRGDAQLPAPDHASGQAERWDTALNRAGETVGVRPPTSNLITQRAAAPPRTARSDHGSAGITEHVDITERGYPVFIQQPYNLGHKSISRAASLESIILL